MENTDQEPKHFNMATNSNINAIQEEQPQQAKTTRGRPKRTEQYKQHKNKRQRNQRKHENKRRQILS